MSFSPEERRAVSSQVREMRAYERTLRFNPQPTDRPTSWDRNMIDYIAMFNGLSFLFNHVRSMDKGNLVLDLGAGTTRGISEISKSRLGQGIRFEATVLSNRSEIEENLGLDKTHITSAESLRGIKNSSVSAVLAGNSLAYSAAPQIAVRRLNEILVPGGVVKATFKQYEGEGISGEHNYQSHGYFTDCLKDLGFDVAVSSSRIKEEIIVAVKPGGKEQVSAERFLQSDSRVIDVGLIVDGHY